MTAFGPRLSECSAELLETVDSTNSEAMRQAARGERGPKWIVARRQSSGRGRGGRVWQSAEGNLQASLLLTTTCALEAMAQLSLVAGVAVCDAIAGIDEAHARAAGLRLKWPNDILLAGAKAGGMLVESTQLSGDRVAVIGVGVNVKEAPVVPGRAITALSDHGIVCDADDLLCRLSDMMPLWLRTWDQGAGIGRIVEAWQERAGPKGELITIDTGGEVVTGGFAGLDESGALLLATGIGQRRFTFGETRLAAVATAAREDG